MSHKKKGSMLLFALGLILLFLTIVALIINMGGSWEAYNRVQAAAEEGARVRAQAVDIYLKEAAGVVEAFHPSSSDYMDNVNHFSYTDVGGHKSPVEPFRDGYQSSYALANRAAQESVVNILNVTLGNNMEGKKILQQFDRDNVCVQVKPLPANASYGTTMDFSCMTKLGEVSASNVKVSPVSPTNTYTLPSDGTRPPQTVKVVNVVFLGVKFDHLHFLEYSLRRFGVSTTETKQVWSIAYPQVDTCYAETC